MSDEIKEIDITPETSFIIANSCQNSLDWQSALCEFIDNSIDAGATVIDIQVGAKHGVVTIKDNGNGCDDLAKFFTFGGRIANGAKSIGRYGVGSKDASLWLCGDKGQVSVESVKGDKVRSMLGDFGFMVSSKRWAIRQEDQSVKPRVNEPAGTTIAISPLTRNHPTTGWNTMLESFGYYYSPAIKKDGVLISFKAKGETVRVEAYKWPDREDGGIDTVLNVKGKSARLVFGIVKDASKNIRQGITYSYSKRVIIPASSKGCGSYSTRDVCGFVELGPEWKLDKNKQGISADAEELFDAVFRAAEGILKIAHSRFEKTESARVIKEAQAKMNLALGFSDDPDSKAIRDGDSTKTGSKVSTGRGGKHKQAGKVQPGNTFQSNRRVNFDFGHFDPSRRHMVGYCEPGGRVLLNADHPAVVSAQKSVDGILSIVAPIYAESVANDDKSGQKRIRGMDRSLDCKSFSEVFGDILNRLGAAPSVP